jgi:hypothetical protein
MPVWHRFLPFHPFKLPREIHDFSSSAIENEHDLAILLA